MASMAPEILCHTENMAPGTVAMASEENAVAARLVASPEFCMGASLFMQERHFDTVGQSLAYGFGSGIGWLIAIVGMAAIREKIRYSKIPKRMQGTGIAFIITGLMGIAFMAFLGISF